MKALLVVLARAHLYEQNVLVVHSSFASCRRRQLIQIDINKYGPRKLTTARSAHTGKRKLHRLDFIRDALVTLYMFSIFPPAVNDINSIGFELIKTTPIHHNTETPVRLK